MKKREQETQDKIRRFKEDQDKLENEDYKKKREKE
jgi:hypothetical protein